MASATTASGSQPTAAEVAECLRRPLFRGCTSWSALDELLLLEAVQKFGFGNWQDVATHVGFTELECRKHYEEVYLSSGSSPLPDISRLLTRSEAEEAEAAAGRAAAEEEASLGADVMTPSLVSRSLAADDGGKPASGIPHAPDDSQLTIKGAIDPDVSGFMPHRGDFDVEWDNDAEQLLADMTFREGEHPTETELKLKVIEIYNAKLDERERRKRFVLERGLLEYKTRLAEERRRPREEREIRNQLRPFARFHSPRAHEELVEALMEEHRIRRRIAQLQHWRRQGIRTLDEGNEFEAARRRRETQLQLRKQRESASYLYEGSASASLAGTSSSSGGAAAAGAAASASGVSATSSSSASSATALASSASVASAGRRRPRDRGRATATAAAAAAAAAAATAVVADDANDDNADETAADDAGNTPRAAAATPGKRSRARDAATGGGAARRGGRTTETSATTDGSDSEGSTGGRGDGGDGPRGSADDLHVHVRCIDADAVDEAGDGDGDSDMHHGSVGVLPHFVGTSARGPLEAAEADESSFQLTGAPGVEALSDDERRLCEHLRLLPSQYVHIKQAIVGAAMRSGLVRRTEMGKLLRNVSADATVAVYDFCVTAGWISAEPGPKRPAVPTRHNTFARAAAAAAAATVAPATTTTEQAASASADTYV